MLKFSDIENWTIVRGPGEAERAAGVVGLVGAKADGTMVLPDGSSPVSGDFVEPAASCLRSGVSAVGWSLTNNTGATASMAVTENSPFGGSALKVTIPNDTGSVDIVASGLGIANHTATGMKKVVLHVYVPDELGIKQVRPYVGTSGMVRSMDYTYPLSNNNQFRVNGHHVIAVHGNNAASNTLLATDTVDDVRLRINAQPSGGVVWIGGVYVPERPASSWLVVTVDDADISMYTRFHAELAARGAKATFGINWDQVGTNDSAFVNIAQIEAMYAYGHDVSSHNRVNTAYAATNPPAAQPSDADRLAYCTAYRYTRGVMKSLGWVRALGYHPYVQGGHDGALNDAMRAHGMTIARAANNNRNVEPFMLDKQGIVSQRSLGSANTLTAARAWVDQAVENGQDVVAMGHALADTASSSITWAQTDFASLLDYAKAAGMRVGSVSEWLADRGVLRV